MHTDTITDIKSKKLSQTTLEQERIKGIIIVIVFMFLGVQKMQWSTKGVQVLKGVRFTKKEYIWSPYYFDYIK